MSKIETVKTYLKLVEEMALSEQTSQGVLHPDYVQWELPNLLNKEGQTSDRADTFRRVSVAKGMLAFQKFEILRAFEFQETCILEALWSGALKIDAGPMKKDQVLKAHFCMFFDFKQGLIHRVKNYDCFEAFL